MVINGAIVSDLDMMYIESVLQVNKLYTVQCTVYHLHSFFYLIIFLYSIYLSINQIINLSIYLSSYLSIYLSIYLCMHVSGGDVPVYDDAQL